MPLKVRGKEPFRTVRQGLSAIKAQAIDAAAAYFDRIRINSTSTDVGYGRFLVNDGDAVIAWANKLCLTGDPDCTAGNFLNTGAILYLQAFNTGANLADDNVAGTIRFMTNNDAVTPENTIAVDVYGQMHDISDGSEGGTFWVVTQDAGADAFVIQARGGRVGLGRDPVSNGAPEATLHSSGSTIIGTATSAVADAALDNGECNIWYDETAEQLKVKVKDSGGTVFTGQIGATLT